MENPPGFLVLMTAFCPGRRTQLPVDLCPAGVRLADLCLAGPCHTYAGQRLEIAQISPASAGLLWIHLSQVFCFFCRSKVKYIFNFFPLATSCLVFYWCYH
jgi:hypothetical protein